MRLLHTMLRVTDLAESKRFYCDTLGMRVLREREYPDGQFTLTFLGYGAESEHTVLELTYNWDKKTPDAYELGTAFGHLAVGTEDIRALAEKIRAAGFKVTREPGPMKFTPRSPSDKPPPNPTIIAFVEDPTGYKVELIERGVEAG